MPKDGNRDENYGGAFRPGVDDIEIDVDWRDRAQRRPGKNDEKGSLLNNAANIYLALKSDPHWRGRFSHDALARHDLLDGKPISDNDVAGVQRWMQLAGMTSATICDCHTQVSSVARENAFDPLVDYLDSLSWDGKPRLEHFRVAWAHQF